jgi:hypothetical protein
MMLARDRVMRSCLGWLLLPLAASWRRAAQYLSPARCRMTFPRLATRIGNDESGRTVTGGVPCFEGCRRMAGGSERQISYSNNVRHFSDHEAVRAGVMMADAGLE